MDEFDSRLQPEESVLRLPPATSAPVATATKPRRYLVVQGPTLLGWSRLELVMRPSRSAAGRFFPEPAFDPLRAVFRKYPNTYDDPAEVASYIRQRDALGLRLLESPG